jgi:DNA-binding beta-propeller fold protein YncE
MRKHILFALVATLLAGAQQKPAINLPTNQVLYDVPGAPQRTNAFPSNIVVSPDGKYAAILNNGRGTDIGGFQQSIAILDLATNKLTDFPDERLAVKARQTYFLGLAFSSRGDEVYASMASLSDPEGKKSGSTGNGIAVYSFVDGKLAPSRFLRIAPQPLPKGKRYVYDSKNAPVGTAIPYPAGLAVIAGENGEHDRILVACNLSDSVLELDAVTGAVLHTFDLSNRDVVPAAYPYTVVASKDGKKAWVSLWNTAEVAELDLVAGTVTTRRYLSGEPISKTSSIHPTALLLAPDEDTLYVSVSNANIVSAIDTRSLQSQPAFISLAKVGPGSTPTSLATTADGTKIFIALSGVNAVAVFNLSEIQALRAEEALGALSEHNGDHTQNFSTPYSLIPTQWYPTAIAVNGNELLIASGKGAGTGPNNRKPLDDQSNKKTFTYIASLLYGSVARVDLAEAEKNAKELTEVVRKSNRFTDEPVKIKFHPEVVAKNRFDKVRRAGTPVGSPIKHVIYVIKENRTYDQLFGDLGVGDGDKELTMFGWDVAPNHHKLALRFGVLDNFYDSGEISGAGHVWSTAATTSDYTERTWQINYRGNERSYDFEGSVGGDYPLHLGIPDVNEPGTGYLWTNAAAHFLTYRHYGEFVDTVWCTDSDWQNSPASTGTATFSSCPKKSILRGESLPANVGDPRGGPSPWPWPVPIMAANIGTKPELLGHFDERYADFKSEYPDQLRMDEFLNEFEQFVAARRDPKLRLDKTKVLPELIVLRLPNDHTLGTKAEMPTPAASVADNDLALGRLVEAVSHSPYWDDTAILVLEDDAQDGPDHVDAHRSIGLVISKYAPYRPKKPLVDHRFYTTVNMIRTLEDLLGLPPMNVNDAHAAPIAPLFSGRGLQPAYDADRTNLANGRLYEVNPKDAAGAKESAEMNFETADSVDAALLNAILWRNRKVDKPMPAPKHTVIPDGSGSGDTDED